MHKDLSYLTQWFNLTNVLTELVRTVQAGTQKIFQTIQVVFIMH